MVDDSFDTVVAQCGCQRITRMDAWFAAPLHVCGRYATYVDALRGPPGVQRYVYC
jgi:hypothetical protein